MPKRTHGESHRSMTPEYMVWASMRARCTRPSHRAYKYYGARGISVCERWMGSFEAFLSDMGRRPGKGYSLDRIDNDGNYEPGNCRWATSAQQMRNTSCVRMIEIDGRVQCLSDWLSEFGRSHKTFRHRVARGWSEQRAITAPAYEGSANARLTAGDVAEIRERFSAGTATQSDLATVYGVSLSAINMIVRRKSWRNVA